MQLDYLKGISLYERFVPSPHQVSYTGYKFNLIFPTVAMYFLILYSNGYSICMSREKSVVEFSNVLHWRAFRHIIQRNLKHWDG
jgi:hypothetical protein